jgi:hypothetical protein
MRAFLSSYFIAKLSKRFDNLDVVQGRAPIIAGTSLPTSHPAGLCPHHCPAFGIGEPRRAAPLYKTALMCQAGQRRRPLGSMCHGCSAARAQLRGLIRMLVS